MATVEQPQVTVRGIPQNQYNENVAKNTQDPADTGQGGGIEAHFKKHWVLYTLGLGAVTILIILYVNNRNSNAASGTSGTDVYGYGTGSTYPNGSPSDNYGSQLDADYQQMINQSNITNSLLQQLLNPSKTGSTGGTSGSGSSSGSSGGHKKKPPKGGKGSKGGTKGGGNTGGSKGGYHGSTGGGHTKTGRSTSSHSVGTSHSHGQTQIKPNPHAGGAHGYVYTTKPGDTAASLQKRFWPGSSASGARNPTSRTSIWNYGNNAKILKPGKNSNWNKPIKPGTRISA